MNGWMKAKRNLKVGRCVWCGHWGLLWGRWCRHPLKKKAGLCRVYFSRWLCSKNQVCEPLPDTDGWRVLRPNSEWDNPGNPGRMRKVFHGLGWRD